MTGDMMHDVSQSQQPASGDDLESLAGRVARAIAALDSLDAASRERAYAAREAIEAFPKAGLTAIVKRLKEDPCGKELFFELVDDPGVRVLLAMHGIIPTASPPTALEPPLELVQIRLPGDTDGWCSGPQADAVTAETPVAFEGCEAKILVLRVTGSGPFAMRAATSACHWSGAGATSRPARSPARGTASDSTPILANASRPRSANWSHFRCGSRRA